MRQTAVATTTTDTSDRVRWGGLATMGAGVLAIVEVLTPLEGRAGPAVFFVFLVLLLVGLAGFHSYQRDAYGRVTAAALYVIAAGAFAQSIATAGKVLGSDALQPIDDLGSLALLVGFLVYGGSTLRGRALPRWCGAAFIGGFLGWVVLAITLGDTGGVLGGVWFGLLWIALGHALWSRRDVPVPHAVPAP